MIRTLILLFCWTTLLSAQSLSQDQIPQALKPWQDWVLFGTEDRFCPCRHDDAKFLECTWPTRLAVEANREGGSFVQEWTVFSPFWVQLPGGASAWPQDVTINGKTQPVLTRYNYPSVFLDRGTYQIKGRWLWKVPPQSLFIPANTGLVTLTLNGAQVTYPRRDNTLLWLELNGALEAAEQDRLSVKVYRLFKDELPMVSTLNIHLDISGKDREVNLGVPLLKGFLPMSIDSPLPAHLDAAGQLIIQAESGSYDIELVSHAQRAMTELSLEQTSETWPSSELWSFASVPNLRAVVPSGMVSIDPANADMPEAWKENPCFQAETGGKLTLAEQSRGLSTYSPNEVRILRQLWLDFDGGGYTYADWVAGTLNAQWRVSFNAPYLPGRVVLKDEPQLITLGGSPALPGVEIRQHEFEMSVIGRLAAEGRVPATGLDLSADKMETMLMLPPGWRLLCAIGPDFVVGDWMSTWTIWSFFLVFLLCVAAGKLWGKKQGLLALASLVLLHAEPGAPQAIWFLLLALIGLERVAKNLLLRCVVFVKYVSLVVLLLICLVFFKNQCLMALYPNIQVQEMGLVGGYVNETEASKYVNEQSGYRKLVQKGMSSPEMESAAAGSITEDLVVQADLPVVQAKRPVVQAELPVVREEREAAYADTKQVSDYLKLQGKIQTGPGVPEWDSYSAHFRWDGPIEPNEGLRLLFLPPWLNLVLTVLRLGLLVWLVALVGGFQLKRARVPKGMATALALCFVMGFASLCRAQEIPPTELLNQLKERLMLPANCFPSCADIEEATLSDEGSQVVLKLTAHAAVRVAMPLPGLPETVSLSGGPATLRFQNGQLWVMLSEGIQEIKCVYQLKDKSVLKLWFPIRPHRLFAALDDWDLSGLREDGTCEEQLELRKVDEAGGTDYAEEEQSSRILNMDVRVMRVARLGSTWRVQSNLVRGNEGPIVLEIPLLPGEKVVSDARVVNGKIQVNLPEGSDEFVWNSTLDPVSEWTWTAPSDVIWHETWVVIPSAIWSISWESGDNASPLIGYFSPTQGGRAGSSLQPSWQPRQGEVLNLKIGQPDPMEGQSLTFQTVELDVSPGQKTTNYKLELNVSSSIGGEHKIQFPPKAIFASHSVDGQELPIRVEDGLLVLPLAPDEVDQVIQFSLPEGIQLRQGVAAIDLKHEAANLTTIVNLPSARWILWFSGPKLGPALLFWPILLTLILVAFGLARQMPDSLAAYQWILLGLGISQLHILAGLIVVLWFVALRWRKNLAEAKMGSAWFGMLQIGLVGLTFAFVTVILLSLRAGLLGQPEMYLTELAENGLTWYQDRSQGALPTVSILSLPFWVYRLVMLFWALWLANSMLRWLREAWAAFSAQRLWPAPAPKRVRPRANPNEHDPQTLDPNGPVANAIAAEPTPTGVAAETQGPHRDPSLDDTLPGGYMAESGAFEQHGQAPEGEDNGGTDEEPPIRKSPS